jgi:predicted small lipoprotein YifL
MDAALHKQALLVLLAVLVAALAGCGSGEKAAAPSAEASAASSTPSEPIKAFIVPGADNNAQHFGEEGTEEEREDMSKALEAFMAARAAGEWKTLCRYTSLREKAVLAGVARKRPGLKGKKCPGIVKAIAGPKAARVDTMTGPVVSVRQEGGTRGYAFYHGAGGVDYYMPMLTHYGDWEVAALAPTRIERP